MSTNTTNSTSTSTTTMSTVVTGFAHLITIKLTTKENYPLWHAQFLPYLRSNNLLGIAFFPNVLGIVDGTIKAPSETTIKTTADGAV
jgi:hypothetical protein